jgi:hypothetical protein
MSIHSFYTISGFLRQNPWGALDNQLDTVKRYQKVHAPWGHTRQDSEEYLANPSLFRKKFAKLFTRFQTGSFLLIAEAEKDYALLVKLTSEPQVGMLDHFVTVYAPRTCGHSPTKPGRGCKNGCASCEDSIVAVYDKNIVTRDTLIQHMFDKCVAEPFQTIWRSIEVVGRVSLITEEAKAVRKYCGCQGSIKTTHIQVPGDLVSYD